MIKEPDMVKLSRIDLHVTKLSLQEKDNRRLDTRRKKCIEKKVGDRRQRQRLSLGSSHPPTYFVLKSGVSISTGQNKIMSAYRVFPLIANNFTLFYAIYLHNNQILFRIDKFFIGFFNKMYLLVNHQIKTNLLQTTIISLR